MLSEEKVFFEEYKKNCEDKEGSIIDYLDDLFIHKFKGSSNKCPNCGRYGCFGSIVRLDVGDAELLVCGWCSNVSKVEEECEEVE